MNLLNDIVTYIRRIVKFPSDQSFSTSLIIDYINRFWINDVDARVQLFDFKTKYQFQTQPGVDRYNMPLYSLQTEDGNQEISYYPVYQGFFGPVYFNGIQGAFYTQKDYFFNTFPNYVQNMVVGTGDGTIGPYNFQIPILGNPNTVNPPVNALLRGHVDIAGVIANGSNQDPIFGTTINTNIPTTSIESAFFLTSVDSSGANVVVQDSGQFLTGNINYGLLMQPGRAPYGNLPLTSGYSTTSNTVNYLTGEVNNVVFPTAIADGANIYAKCYYFQGGLPRGLLYYNNVLTLRMPPSQSWLVELDAYLSPAAYLTTASRVQYGYMSEYIARGAAQKILSDLGDVEQFMFYKPLFEEQEMLVWKRSQRQFTSTRTQTIYSQRYGYNNYGNYWGGNL